MDIVTHWQSTKNALDFSKYQIWFSEMETLLELKLHK